MPRDLKHFAAVTRGHIVIMGRNTYESIISRLGKPLPDRQNIVVTRQKDFKAPGCIVANSLDEALNQTSSRVTLEKTRVTLEKKEVFVIGGTQLYAEAMPKAEKIYRTLIHTNIEGDAFFPAINPEEWELIESKFESKDNKNPFDASYEIYIRKKI